MQHSKKPKKAISGNKNRRLQRELGVRKALTAHGKNIDLLSQALANQSQVMGTFAHILMALQEKTGLTNEDIQAVADKFRDQQESDSNKVQSKQEPADEDTSGTPKLRVLRDKSDDTDIGGKGA